MDNLPPVFRDKWSILSVQVDPSGRPFANILGSASDLSDNPERGQTFNFENGALISYGSNQPPILVYGDIYNYWNSLGGLNSGFGHPIADPQFLPDGSICSIFEGNHIHRLPGGREVSPIAFSPNQCYAHHKPPLPTFLANGTKNWPPAFRQQWASLAVQTDSDGKQFASLMGPADNWPHDWPGLTDNENGGKILTFRFGRLVSYNFQTPPFLVYGKIFALWNDLGGVRSGLGHPLMDPQVLGDGTVCNIFEGGHIHQIATRDAEIVPADQCTAEHHPTVPPAVASASTFWPAHFRQKWTWLSAQRDPSDKQLAGLLGPTDSWPHDWPGLTNNENGGKTLHFRFGRLISRTFQAPPLLIYGTIYNLWNDLGAYNSGLGMPLADPQFLEDGSTCSIFEGGHVHHFGSAEPQIVSPEECIAPHKPTASTAALTACKHWTLPFRNKWIALSTQRDPYDKQLASLMGPTDSWPHDWPGLTDNGGGGKSLHFRFGRLISTTFQSPPFLIYGKIYNFWDDISGLDSGLGYPLADPQYLEDGSVCSVFQGGHVHQFGSRDPQIVPAEECTAPNKPVASGALLTNNQYWPPLFRAKWTTLACQSDHNGKQFPHLMGPADCWPYDWPGLVNNESGGKMLHFRYGVLVSYDNQTPPCLIYGNIYTTWKNLGALKSDFKYPLADPQFLPDGSVCSVFEGGHIHFQLGANEAAAFPAGDCPAPFKPTSRASVIQAKPTSPPVQEPRPLAPAPIQAPQPFAQPPPSYPGAYGSSLPPAADHLSSLAPAKPHQSGFAPAGPEKPLSPATAASTTSPQTAAGQPSVAQTAAYQSSLPPASAPQSSLPPAPSYQSSLPPSSGYPPSLPPASGYQPPFPPGTSYQTSNSPAQAAYGSPTSPYSAQGPPQHPQAQPSSSTPQGPSSSHRKPHGTFDMFGKMVGKGMRNLGTGINRMADSLEHNFGQN